MPHPINDPQFWSERLKRAGSDYHRAVWDVPAERWRRVQDAHFSVLRRVVKPGQTVLDAGCGYGALCEILHEGVDYAGVDLSPDLLALGRELYPDRVFIRADLACLPVPDGSYDVCIARSLEGTIRDNLGQAAWLRVFNELCRVANRVVLLSYGEPELFYVHDVLDDASHETRNSITYREGVLTYRYGTGGVIEIADIFVNEQDRRKGVGTKMIKTLQAKTDGAIYAFTRESNGEARAFYERLGFRGVSVPNFYHGQAAVLYVKG